MVPKVSTFRPGSTVNLNPFRTNFNWGGGYTCIVITQLQNVIVYIPPITPHAHSTAEFCLGHLLFTRHPTMFYQHFVECVFHFNNYEKHRGTDIHVCLSYLFSAPIV